MIIKIYTKLLIILHCIKMPLHGSLKKVSENNNSPRQNRTSCLRTRHNKDEASGEWQFISVYCVHSIVNVKCLVIILGVVIKLSGIISIMSAASSSCSWYPQSF